MLYNEKQRKTRHRFPYVGRTVLYVLIYSPLVCNRIAWLRTKAALILSNISWLFRIVCCYPREYAIGPREPTRFSSILDRTRMQLRITPIAAASMSIVSFYFSHYRFPRGIINNRNTLWLCRIGSIHSATNNKYIPWSRRDWRSEDCLTIQRVKQRWLWLEMHVNWARSFFNTCIRM